MGHFSLFYLSYNESKCTMNDAKDTRKRSRLHGNRNPTLRTKSCPCDSSDVFNFHFVQISKHISQAPFVKENVASQLQLSVLSDSNRHHH